MADIDGENSNISPNEDIILKKLKERISLINGTFNIDTGSSGTTIMIELPFNYTNLKYGS